MSMSGPHLFHSWVSLLWIVALAVILVFHCAYLARHRGQRRWYHLAHVVMLLGMIYMYAIMSFPIRWVSGSTWVRVYVIATLAIAVWLVIRIAQRRPVSFLWVLALVQQGAMIYMWLPMMQWRPWLTYIVSLYFVLEAVAWLIGRCDDSGPRGNAVGPGDRALVVPLGHTSLWGRLGMAVMALSMAYMFVGMQLMMM